MKKILDLTRRSFPFLKLSLKMKISMLFMFMVLFTMQAKTSYSQGTKITLDLNNVTVIKLIDEIESRTEFHFVYQIKDVDLNRIVSIKANKETVPSILKRIFGNTSTTHHVVEKQIFLKDRTIAVRDPFEKKVITSLVTQQNIVSGVVTDSNGQPLSGANIVEKGTTNGVTADFDGNFSISMDNDSGIIVVSYIGFATKEVNVNGQKNLNIRLEESAASLDEVVLIGYGTQRKSDLTGSVLRADIESFENQPNVSLLQSLQGSLPGLNVGQVGAVGENPSVSIRGRTSLSGQQEPLIVLDGAIYRGSIIDINPNDIASVDVLKDASATAVYGSQAANGVILITSKSGKGPDKIVFNFKSSVSVQSPIRELRAGSPESYVNEYIDGYILNSRLAPDYIQLNPDYDFTASFKTEDMVNAYKEGQSTDWHDLLTNSTSLLSNHNISMAYNGDTSSTFMSIGYTDQEGYHVGEDYTRWNVRMNMENRYGDWLKVGVQSFLTSSDFSGLDIDRSTRYLPPYALSRQENGELNPQPGGLLTNPLNDILNADHEDYRFNIFGNIYAQIDLPFVKGLSYKINYTTNYRNNRENIFKPYGANFQGLGSKENVNERSYSSDNILTYNNTFNDKHNLNLTLLYGFEKRKGEGTFSSATNFADPSLGFNGLEIGQADLQQVASSAFEESSLYSMARLTYNFSRKYYFTATIRRDGFSGFGREHKFGTFPSTSLAWALNEENFLKDLTWLNTLKMRASYGVSGNRTIARYQTLSVVNGGFNYVDAEERSLYSQQISDLANANLKWETTNGFNLGVDFRLFNNRVNGSVDYYRNTTEDILYTVRIPEITGFNQLPVNLGKLGNHGVDINLNTVNINTKDFNWNSTFNFSRNRDELISLLGADNDGDGIEDDLISDNLFIGESLQSIYDLQITGDFYQLNDEIPSGFDVGAFKIEDKDGVDGITPDDRVILGSESPSYRFSLQNQFSYRNWNLMVFVNSIQGGKNMYLGRDDLLAWNTVNSEGLLDRNLPAGVDYWTPENPDARYQKLLINVSNGLVGRRYTSRNFVRLQDVSLGYDFDSKLLEKLHLSKLKLFFSGKNLVTWTKYNGWDPELGTGLDLNGSPVLKTYTLGLNIEF